MAAMSAGSLLAGEYAVLANGFRIHADRHETAGDTVKLYMDGGFSVLPASQISSYEEEAAPVPPPAPPADAIAPAVATVPAPAPAVVDSKKPLDPKQLADEAAKRHNLPEALIRSIMHAESAFQPQVVSPKGAIGLMQLMPGTAQQLHADPHDPRQNVEAGTVYLRSLLAKYENNDDQVARAVAAYNAGPGAVDRYNGVPPYRETREYVIRVLSEYLKALQDAKAPAVAIVSAR